MERGIFIQEDQPEYVESYHDLTATLQKIEQKGAGTPEGGHHG
jgi:hypothetical protein